MKQAIFTLILLFAFSTMYASFPVKRNASNVEVVESVTSKGEITSKTNSLTAAYVADAAAGFNLGGFALGLLLGLIGVALAHIFWKDKTFRRSSWYGFGVLLIIVIILSL